MKTKIEPGKLSSLHKATSSPSKVFSLSSINIINNNKLHSLANPQSFPNSHITNLRIFSNPQFKMQFTIKSTFFLALFASTSIFAAPVDVEARDAGDLETRAKAKPRVLVNCNGVRYTHDQITASMNQAWTLGHSGGYSYPEEYRNEEGLFGATGQLYSFPLSDPVWTSKRPILRLSSERRKANVYSYRRHRTGTRSRCDG